MSTPYILFYELVLISFNALPPEISINIVRKYKNSLIAWLYLGDAWSGTGIMFWMRLEHVGSALDIHYSATLNILQYSTLADNTSFICRQWINWYHNFTTPGKKWFEWRRLLWEYQDLAFCENRGVLKFSFDSYEYSAEVLFLCFQTVFSSFLPTYFPADLIYELDCCCCIPLNVSLSPLLYLI